MNLISQLLLSLPVIMLMYLLQVNVYSVATVLIFEQCNLHTDMVSSYTSTTGGGDLYVFMFMYIIKVCLEIFQLYLLLNYMYHC